MSRQYRRKIQRQIQKLIRRRSRSRSNRVNHRTLDFAQLEPKQLLAVIGTPLPSGANLVNNGDFENVDLANGNLLDSSDVPGWGASLSTGGAQINVFNTIRTGNILELDSTTQQIDVVFQDIDTTFGDHYILAFDLRERDAGSGADATSNDVEVFWDGESLGVFSADVQWQSVVNRVEGGESDTTRLEFREIASGSDGIGGLIDNVRLVTVSAATIANGSFENLTARGEALRAADFIADAEEVNAWMSAAESEAARRIHLLENGGSTHGRTHLNLETTAAQTDVIYQDVSTIAGEQYYLTFDLRGDSSESTASNELRIRWDGEWAGTYHGGDDWQSFGILVDADSDLSRLVFRETASGAGSGPLIDNVRLHMLGLPDSSVGPILNDLLVDIDVTRDGTDGIASFSEGSGPTSIITNGLTLSHDSNNTLTFAVARIENLLDGSFESLSVEVGDTGLRARYDAASGRLNISGTASLERYQAVLETLKYDNTSTMPTTENRSVSISITDREIAEGNNFSRRAFIDLAITEFNAVPMIEAIEDRDIDFGTAFSLQVVASDDEGSPLVYELSTTGNVGSSAPSISNNGRISWDAVVADGSEVEFTVTVTDSEGASAQEQFTVAVSAFEPFAGQRALSNIPPALRNDIYSSAPEMTINTNLDYVAVLRTDVGDIRLELFDDQAPITVNNFVNLANDGFYDGLTFHRVVSGFVAQGGDPLGTGAGGPGYTFQDEFVNELVFDKRGQLAMANSGPGTNGSQFFITYAAQPHLTGGHTIFGQLTNGDVPFDSIAVTGPGVEDTVILSVEIVSTVP